MRALLLLVVIGGCVQSDVVVCDNGDACPAGTACDEAHGLCVLPAQLTACGGAANDSPCSVDGAAGVCKDDVCMLPNCGDGIRVEPELCDGEDVGTANCTQFGFYNSKPPLCNNACNFDTSQCSGYCGDGMLNDQYELCEANSPPTATCVDYGYGAGVLGCETCGPGFATCKTLAWSEMALPSPPSDVHGLSDSDLYAALGSGGLYHFDGVAWTQVVLPCAMTNDRFDDVWEAAPGVVFVSGGPIVIRVAGGACTRWTPAVGRDLQDIWAASADVAYAISSDPASGILRLENGDWTLHLARPGYVIWGSGANDVYASDTSVPVQLSHFDGVSWSAAQAIAGVTTISALWGTGPTDVYLGGSGPLFAIVKHTTNGTLWTPMLEDEPVVTTGASSSIIGAGITVGGRTYVAAFRVAGTGYSGFILEHDGTGWANLDAPILGSGFVWASDAGRVYAASGFSGGVLVLDRSVLVSHRQQFVAFDSALAAHAPNDAYLAANGLQHWDGREWTLSTDGPVDVAIDPNGKVFGVDASGLYPSPSWTKDTTVAGTRVSAPAANVAWVLDDANKRIRRWSGTAQASPPDYASSRPMTDLWAAADGDVFVVGQGGQILRWHNNAWTTMTSGTTRDLLTIYGRSANDVYAAGQQVLLHYNGNAWSELPFPPVTVIYSVWATTADDIFAGSNDGLWYFDGTQWSPVDLSTPFRVPAIAGVGDSVFVHDFKGTVHQIIRTAEW